MAKSREPFDVCARSARGHQSAEDLIEAARKCFSEKGYTDTRVASILRAANLTNGSAYHAFRDGKPDLAAAVYERWSKGQRGELEAIVVGPRTPLRQLLGRDVLPKYARWFTSAHGRARFMLEVEALGPSSATRMATTAAREEMQSLLTKLLGKAEGAPQLAHLRPAVIDALVLGPIRVAISSWVRKPSGVDDPAKLTATLGAAAAASLLSIAGEAHDRRR